MPHDTHPDPTAGLPPTFRWGVATSAYQIEGAADEDGRTPSIWDTFCRQEGTTAGGDDGTVACDHYHRMPQDVALISDLGVDTYRFSVSWPRVQPGGRGPVNPRGVAFYDRLVDELLGAGVDPWVTLYHWDLPQELQDAGGWPERDTAHRFADYAMLVLDQLGDRVDTWTTLNEPWVSAWMGHVTGEHAPGHRNLQAGVDAVHHLLLGHGLATRRMRAAAPRPLRFGITLNLSTIHPATETEYDRAAARRADGLATRIYLDPLRYGRYPDDVLADLGTRRVAPPARDGDLEIISAPLDILGVNYYFGQVFAGTDEAGRTTNPDGTPVVRQVEQHGPRTAMGWPINPEGLTELLIRTARDYPDLPMVVTENGAAFDDVADDNGFVRDDDRVDFLARHIAAVAAAHRQGVDVRGYFAWSLMDNFEWTLGYGKRFGLVRVDYETQRRTPKRSARWFRDTIRTFHAQSGAAGDR